MPGWPYERGGTVYQGGSMSEAKLYPSHSRCPNQYKTKSAKYLSSCALLYARTKIRHLTMAHKL